MINLSCRRRRRSSRRRVKNITRSWTNTWIFLPRRRRVNFKRLAEVQCTFCLVCEVEPRAETLTSLRLKCFSPDYRQTSSWTGNGWTSMNRRWSTCTRSTRCRTGRSSTWWNRYVQLPLCCHMCTTMVWAYLRHTIPSVIPRWEWLLRSDSSSCQCCVCKSCFAWTGAGVSSQHPHAQQPDSGDDSGLYAVQAGTAAQLAERKWRHWRQIALARLHIEFLKRPVSACRRETTMRALARGWRSWWRGWRTHPRYIRCTVFPWRVTCCVRRSVSAAGVAKQRVALSGPNEALWFLFASNRGSGHDLGQILLQVWKRRQTAAHGALWAEDYD